jgi:hypothetical protein
MGVAPRERQGDDTFGASDRTVKWLEGIAGFLANVKAEYGSISEMVERPGWDAARNPYILSLLKGLKKELNQFAAKFKSHVDP